MTAGQSAAYQQGLWGRLWGFMTLGELITSLQLSLLSCKMG